MKKIYLDYAATTPVAKEVFESMKPYFEKEYGNPSEPHLLGQKAKKGIEEAREKWAKFLGASPKEIFFTSSATESINLAHKGLIEALKDTFKLTKRPHIITSSIEHKAVLETCHHLQNLGWAEITFLPVDKFGRIKVADVTKAIKPETVLISIMYVNNEVGTIQPIGEIGHLIKQRNIHHKPKIFFHTDATQAVQYLNCQVDFLGVDLLSLTGHKIYAPKGIGLLFIRSGTPMTRQMDGGGQEQELRAGTENVPFIVALGSAVEKISTFKEENVVKLQKLRDELIEKVLEIPGVKLTGHPNQRAPHIASFVVEGVEGESLVLLLSQEGIFVSSGSACTSQSLEPSHVLTALGILPQISHGSIRFSLGRGTKENDIEYLCQIFPKVVERLRKMAPKL